MNNHLKGLLIAFFGILILTPDAVLVRLADSNSWTVLFWRGLFFAAGIIVILLITYRSKAVNELINIGKGGVLIGLLTGLGGTSFILAIHYTSIAKTLVIISISPIMVAIVSLIMLKEKPALYTWISMIIVFIGIYIVMAGDRSGMNLMGNLFVKPEQFIWNSGKDNRGEYLMASPNTFGNAFCKTCGSRVPRNTARGWILTPLGSSMELPGIEPTLVCPEDHTDWFTGLESLINSQK